MKAKRVARVAVVLAAVQMLLVGGLWWLLSERQPPPLAARRAPSSTMATQRLAEVYANAAFRAVITSDYAGLNELIRRSLAWSEVAYISVEDAQGKIIASTDPSKVGRTWDTRLANELRTSIKVAYEEVTAPLVDPGGAKGGTPAGQLRLGYAAGGPPAPSPRPSPRVPLSVALAFAAVASIPVAVGIDSIGRKRVGPRDSSSMTPKEQRLLEQLRETRAEAQRLRNDVAQEVEETSRVRSERDRHLAEVAELRNSITHYMVELQKLRADAARVEADLASADPAPPAEKSAPESSPLTDPRPELKRLQAQTMTQVAQAFRSSLTNILGYSKLLLRGADGELSAAQKANVTNILESGTRLVVMVNALADYVRTEAGPSQATPTPVDLAPLLTRIMADSPRPRLALAQVTEVQVDADPRHLEQILRALVTDALALDPQAAGRLSATSSQERVVIELVLTGFHASPQELRHLLDPLGCDQEPPPLDESRLRLALARGLAEANGGQLRVVPGGAAEVAFVVELQAVPTVTA